MKIRINDLNELKSFTTLAIRAIPGHVDVVLKQGPHYTVNGRSSTAICSLDFNRPMDLVLYDGTEDLFEYFEVFACE
jgi:hypothetical protein